MPSEQSFLARLGSGLWCFWATSSKINEILPNTTRLYVTGYNTAIEQHAEAKARSEFAKKIDAPIRLNLDNLALTNTKLAGIQRFWSGILLSEQGERWPIGVVLTAVTKTRDQSLLFLWLPSCWERPTTYSTKTSRSTTSKAIWNVINWKEAEEEIHRELRSQLCEP
ncbi:hypothetical protein JCM33374_g6462 [Metschnikowia sp. JCM 33374]|nr:hypothetical protein JCM33374_g6462 [Metschnikowia sp. JCM 33374]